MAHGDLANRADQRSQSKRVLLRVPAVVQVCMRIDNYDGHAAREFRGDTRHWRELLAGYRSVQGATQAKVVGKTAIEQMDETAMCARVRMRLQSHILEPTRSRGVLEDGVDPFRFCLRVLGRVVFQDHRRQIDWERGR